MRADDAFWAARRVVAFTDDLIRAAVRTGQFSDPAAEKHLGDVLIKRRDAIGRVYLNAINPIVNPRLDASGALTFDNAAVAAGFREPASGCTARAWSRFDNATGATRPLGDTQSPTAVIYPRANLPPAAGGVIAVAISADSTAHASWQQPVRDVLPPRGRGLEARGARAGAPATGGCHPRPHTLMPAHPREVVARCELSRA